MRKEKIKQEFLKLLNWTPEYKGILKPISKIIWGKNVYEKTDEDCPFISEAYLYNLIGKQDARTLLALLRNIIEAIGFDRFELEDLRDKEGK